MPDMTQIETAPRQMGWKQGDPADGLLTREWIVTNGLGGYASGTIGGACTRRFHGNLIAALPVPLGRTMMLNHLHETIIRPDGAELRLTADERAGEEAIHPAAECLETFELQCGLPVWTYRCGHIRLEKRLLMPNLQNTTWIWYRLLEGPDGTALRLRPSLHFRPHEGLVSDPIPETWRVGVNDRQIEIAGSDKYPPLRILLVGSDGRFVRSEEVVQGVIYRIERSRGYEFEGPLWSPGTLDFSLRRDEPVAIVASTEEWPVIHALDLDEAQAAELNRLKRLLHIAAHKTGDDDFAQQLVLAAEQFIVVPKKFRPADTAFFRAFGDEARTVIAGYHWFTDWGRDTMISLEGLTLCTGRQREAGSILRTFASYIRDGLIPNMFPEGEQGGLYHTADASMWFFHAVDRYIEATRDHETLDMLLPRMIDIIDHHLRGTDFGIRVDPADGLLTQGAEGYQLTWMDAKVGDWVVTPRRGKPVEINALYYNALCVLEKYLKKAGQPADAKRFADLAARARESFNRRFWLADGQYLYDVVDGPDGDDRSIRPNQIFSISLPNPVLERERWKPVVAIVEEKLLTPVGLRSLAPGHADYKSHYDGDLRARDAAYHQGTVWGWLIGPFIDAWLKTHGEDKVRARAFLDGFRDELAASGIGTISEVFDATAPYTPRGCIAQAWSVAEVLRCTVKLA